MNATHRSRLGLDHLWAAVAACDEAIVEAERDAMSPTRGGERAAELAQEAVVAAEEARRSAIVA